MTSFIDNDGNELDYDGKDLPTTKQAISFLDFRIRADFSSNVKIRNTAKNKKLIGYVSDNQLNNVIRKIINVYRNGIKSHSGYLILASIDEIYIECFFISGNAQWTKLWDFKCSEIQTTRYDVFYQLATGGNTIDDTFSNTSGIVFPVVDFCMRGEKWGRGVSLRMNAGDSLSPTIRGFVPFIYVHTLLQLLSNHAGTKISGSLFNDPFFKTIIIGPESMSSWAEVNDAGNQKVIKPEHIAPQIKAIDFIKWVAITFGCQVTFDEDEIYINIIDKINESEAKDWSAYYVSHETQISKYYDKNYFRWKESDEENISTYNETRTIRYGDLLVDGGRGDGSTKDIYNSPFYPSYDIIGTTPIQWATPICDYYTLEDDKEYTFTSVTKVTSVGLDFIDFNGADFPWSPTESLQGTIIRVPSGIYKGFHWRRSAGDNDTQFSSQSFNFIGDVSGTFFTQRVTINKGHRVLSCIPGVSPLTVTQYSSVYPSNSTGTLLAPVSTIATAYFHKCQNLYSGLLTHPDGLAFGKVDRIGNQDNVLADRYLRRYSSILMRAPIKASMIIPEHEFYSFNFGIIFIQTKNLTGYFLVEKIENYESSSRSVNVILVRI